MRLVFLALSLLLAACGESFNDRTNRRLDTAEPEVAAIRAELAALKMQVGALPSTPDVIPIVERVAALEVAVAKVSTSKHLHRIGSGGDDLGLGSPGSPWVFRPTDRIEYRLGDPVLLYYANPDCEGEPRLPFNAGNGYYIGPASTLLLAAPDTAQEGTFRSAQFFNANAVGCKNAAISPTVTVKFLDTGIRVELYTLDQTHLEER